MGLVPRQRMSGAVPPVPHMTSQPIQGLQVEISGTPTKATVANLNAVGVVLK
jgi:hypothetical protein